MTTPLVIAFVDLSSSPEVKALLPEMVHAFGRQVIEHVQPYWSVPIPTLEITKTPQPYASQIALFDDADQADVLGYHGQTPTGQPYGRVFVETILKFGGSIANGANSVSSVLSHELLETIGDPNVNMWFSGPDGYDYAAELCDVCEFSSYVIDDVSVANFILPSFFDALAPAGTRLDYLGLLSQAFVTPPNGYQIRRKGGVIENVFGASFPEWKREIKSGEAARSSRRARRA